EGEAEPECVDHRHEPLGVPHAMNAIHFRPVRLEDPIEFRVSAVGRLTERSCRGHRCSYCAGMALRVGIVGTGFGARVQVPGFRAAGYEVTAICSAHAERARAVAEQAGIPAAVATVSDLVERDDVDVVSVTSPPTLHREHTLAALAAGKHVICEKPMARDSREAREMLAAAERAGVVHAIDHEFRYTPARSKVKELLEARAAGGAAAGSGRSRCRARSPTRRAAWSGTGAAAPSSSAATAASCWHAGPARSKRCLPRPRWTAPSPSSRAGCASTSRPARPERRTRRTQRSPTDCAYRRSWTRRTALPMSAARSRSLAEEKRDDAR